MEKRIPSISNLLDKTDTLYTRYSYPSTEITEDLDKCREKSDSVGDFTKPVPHILGENEQYICLPQFMTTKDGEEVALEIKKITSADEKKIPTISILNTSLISPLIALTGGIIHKIHKLTTSKIPR